MADASFISVAAGRFHTCGIRADGTAHCWGDNGFGRATVPQEYQCDDFAAITAGRYHTYAIYNTGQTSLSTAPGVAVTGPVASDLRISTAGLVAWQKSAGVIPRQQYELRWAFGSALLSEAILNDPGERG